MTGLAADQDPAHRAGSADAAGGIATQDLMRRRVRQIGPMPLAGVNDQHPGAARRVKHLPAWLDGGLQARDVIAERLAKAARLQEIALHVDDNQRSPVEIDGKRRGLGLEIYVWHIHPLASLWREKVQEQGQRRQNRLADRRQHDQLLARHEAHATMRANLKT